MLSGLQQMSFIPGTSFESFTPGAGPSYEDVVSGMDMVKYNKIPVRISEFHAEVFDLMDAADRARYEDRMKELVEGIQSSSCVIWKNELQVLSSGGDQRWMRYLEWARYELNAPSAAPSPDKPGSVPPAGVIQTVDRGNKNVQ